MRLPRPFPSPATTLALTAAHAAGRACYLKGLPLDENPYAPEGITGQLHTAWSAGWHKEKAAEHAAT